jgi:hypothetical protein
MRVGIGVFARAVALAIVVVGAQGDNRALAQQAPANPAFSTEYEKGQDAYNLGKYDEARARFEAARDLGPDKPGPYRWLGRLARVQKRWRECIDNSVVALKLNPTSSQAPEVRKDITQCRLALGRPAYEGNIPAAQGALAVIANVEGAAVEVDGLKKGATPLPPFALNPGKRQVYVSLEGYLPADVEVEIVQTIVVDLEVTLDPDPNYVKKGNDKPNVDSVKVGWLSLTVGGGVGSTITFDGGPPPIGPDGVMEAPSGIHTIEVTAPGYEPWRRRVWFVRGQRRSVLVLLKLTEVRERQRLYGHIALGAATLFGVTGVVYGLRGNAAFETVEEWTTIERKRPRFGGLARGLPESQSHTREQIDEERRRAEGLDQISNIAYGAAAVALGVSIFFYVQERSAERVGYALPLAVLPVESPPGGYGGHGAQVVYTGGLPW